MPLRDHTPFAGLLLLAASQLQCERSPAPTPSPSREASAKSSTSGIASARIYASRDRGRTWLVSASGVPRHATVNDFAVVRDAVFATTEADGVYVSRDAGQNWHRVVRTLGTGAALTALAATSTSLFVGTRRDGVFTSLDSGKTWAATNQGLENREVRRLVATEDRVFAATNGGLFVSEDAAASWRHLTGSGQTNGFAALRGVLYVADLQGVLRSRDAGKSWERVYDGATPHNLGAAGNAVFALLYGRGVVKSVDDGGTWTKAQAGLPDDLSQYTFQVVAADGLLFGAQWHGVYASESNGDAWRLSSAGLPPDQAITDIVRVSPNLMLAAAVGSIMKP